MSKMLKLLRNVRKAIRQWRALPAEDRDQYRHHVGHIRMLVAELGGGRALSYVDGADDAHSSPVETSELRRPRLEVIAELETETAALLAALSSPAAELAMNSVPTSARLGARLARKGLGRVAQRQWS
jgi:hypothetical protein